MKQPFLVICGMILLFVIGSCKKDPVLIAGNYQTEKVFNGVSYFIELQLNESGELSWVPLQPIDGWPAISSKYTLIDDVLVEFSQTDGCEAAGRYLYSFDGKELTLMSDRETCEKRMTAFRGKWQKTESK